MSWFPFFISWPSLIPFRNQGFLCMALLFIFMHFPFCVCVINGQPCLFLYKQDLISLRKTITFFTNIRLNEF